MSSKNIEEGRLFASKASLPEYEDIFTLDILDINASEAYILSLLKENFADSEDVFILGDLIPLKNISFPENPKVWYISSVVLFTILKTSVTGPFFTLNEKLDVIPLPTASGMTSL